MLLKADFHVHTSEDPEDPVEFSARELIGMASLLGYDVLSITNHNTVTWNEGLAQYAGGKGILLLPGVELSVAGRKHVLAINTHLRGNKLGERFPRFEDLAGIRGEKTLIIAPHPFYKAPVCVGRDLEKHHGLFDAIEASHFYCRLINPNRAAERFSIRHGLPMVGTSDAHFRSQFGRTYSLVEADRAPRSVVEAVKKGRIRVEALRSASQAWGRYSSGSRGRGAEVYCGGRQALPPGLENGDVLDLEDDWPLPPGYGDGSPATSRWAAIEKFRLDG